MTWSVWVAVGMKRMIKEEGGEALFAGLVPLVLKEVLFVMSKFAVFEFVSSRPTPIRDQIATARSVHWTSV
eukprot:3379054-Rhodomonas_salina.2